MICWFQHIQDTFLFKLVLKCKEALSHNSDVIATEHDRRRWNGAKLIWSVMVIKGIASDCIGYSLDLVMDWTVWERCIHLTYPRLLLPLLNFCWIFGVTASWSVFLFFSFLHVCFAPKVTMKIILVAFVLVTWICLCWCIDSPFWESILPFLLVAAWIERFNYVIFPVHQFTW